MINSYVTVLNFNVAAWSSLCGLPIQGNVFSLKLVAEITWPKSRGVYIRYPTGKGHLMILVGTSAAWDLFHL